MIINIHGNINSYYIQTLCMIYFPGVKFPEGESIDENTVVADITAREDNKAVTVHVRLSRGAFVCDGEWTEKENVLLGDMDRIRKIAAGRAFMLAGEKFTGFIPPWGIMTGVRPAKLVSEYLNNGYAPEQAAEILQNEYFVNSEKAALAVRVAKEEAKLITDEKRKECSIYIAVPFCPSRCAYCSFVSYTSPGLLKLIPEYLAVLCDDIDRTLALVKSLGLRISTVYIGGGTPTVLHADQLRCLLSHIAERIDNVVEFTLEAGRPDTITIEKMAAAKSYGVNRVSVNTQTLNDEVLAAIGRKHTSEEFFAAYDAARAAGISAINIDLIAGLPTDTASSFSDTIDRIMPLHPENITVHTFCVKKSAELVTKQVYDREGAQAIASVAYSYKTLTAAGYMPYYMYRQKNTVGNLENVGYAKEGYEGLYNVYMMEEVHSIFACGASAVTKFVSLPAKDGSVRIERLFQPKYPYEYLHADEREKRFAELEKTAYAFFSE